MDKGPTFRMALECGRGWAGRRQNHRLLGIVHGEWNRDPSRKAWSGSCTCQAQLGCRRRGPQGGGQREARTGLGHRDTGRRARPGRAWVMSPLSPAAPTAVRAPSHAGDAPGSAPAPPQLPGRRSRPPSGPKPGRPPDIASSAVLSSPPGSHRLLSQPFMMRCL